MLQPPAEHEELVVGVGDAVHPVRVEPHRAVGVAGAVAGGVEALPRHGQQHTGLWARHHGEVQHGDVGARQDRTDDGAAATGRPATAADLEAREGAVRTAGAGGADAERVGDVDVAASRLAAWLADEARRWGRHGQRRSQHEKCRRHRKLICYSC